MRRLFGLLIPLACGVLFVRLGIWQLSRHRERTRAHVILSTQLAARAVRFESLGVGAESLSWRRVRAAGRFRYDLEQVLQGRTNAGSPGVHLITPLERADSDTLLVVARGWVYSANAREVELARWREHENVEIEGYLLPVPDSGPVQPAPDARALRSLDRAELSRRLGRPVAAWQLVMTSDSAPRIDSVPRRLRVPVTDSGPHLSYAIQWFAFATIAIAGGVLLFRRSAG